MERVGQQTGDHADGYRWRGGHGGGLSLTLARHATSGLEEQLLFWTAVAQPSQICIQGGQGHLRARSIDTTVRRRAPRSEPRSAPGAPKL